MRKQRTALAVGIVGAIALGGAVSPCPFGTRPAFADEDPPPPPPPPRKKPASGTIDPTHPDFRGALLGDVSDSRDVGDERITTAVGGRVSQPVWIKQPGMELRCDNVVIWGDKGKLTGALAPQIRKDAKEDPRSILGPVIHAIYAEGNVFLRRDDHVIEADRVLIDWQKNRAYIVNARIVGRHVVKQGGRDGEERSIPLVVRAAVARGTADAHYMMENAGISSSAWEKPQIEFTTENLEVDYGGSKARFETGWWPTVRMDTALGAATPVLTVPKLGGALGSQGVQTVEFGTSNRFGVTVGLGFGGKIEDDKGADWGSWQVTPRYRTARGAGLELKYERETTSTAQRGARGFYEIEAEFQRDGEDEDSYSERPFDGEIGGKSDSNRGRAAFFWRDYGIARSLFGNDSRLDVAVDWYSDRGYLPEYHSDDSTSHRQQESYVSLTTKAGDQGMSILASTRLADEAVSLVQRPSDLFLTDYATQTTYMPSVTYHLVSHPILRGKDEQFIPYPSLSVQAGVARVERNYDDFTADGIEAVTGWKGRDVLRGDLETRLTAPFSVGPVEISPSFGASIYGVDEANGFANVGTSKEDDAESRTALSAGVRVGTQTSRLYDVQNQTLDLRGLRHIASTDVQWFNRFDVSTEDEAPDYFQANDLQDRLFEQNVVSWRVRNRLQTKRAGEVTDWFDLETRFLWYADETPAPGPSGLGLREDFASPLDRLDFAGEDKYLTQTRDGSAFIQNRARLELLSNVWLMGDTDHDFQTNENETTGVGVRWFVNRNLSMYLGRRTIEDSSAIWTLRGDYLLSEKWGLSTEFQEETKSNRGLRTRVGMFRRSREYTIAVEFESERLLDETGIALALYPHEWVVRKSDPFSQRRPLDFSALRWYR